MMNDRPDLDEEEILEALIIGGNVLANLEGAKKRRRRVPRKQAQLVRLITEVGRADFDDLASAFSKEWAKILKNRKGEYILIAKHEFYRNVADLAGRINAALVAAYANPECVERATLLTGGRFIGLAFDHQRFEMWWLSECNIEDLNSVLKIAIGADHVRLRDRPDDVGSGPQEATETISEPAGITPFVSVDQTPPSIDTIIDAEFEEIGEEPVTGSESPSPPPAPQSPSSPESRPEQQHATAPDVLDVTVDPITKAWSFQIDGIPIEIQPRHAYVRIDGDLVRVPALPPLSDIGDLAGEALELILDVIRLRASQSEIEERLGQGTRRQGSSAR